ncbi:MAG: hypothetical protein PHN72_07025 [Bacilli bacterium]|nr:hypothetical protein [Bacilli bacterium]
MRKIWILGILLLFLTGCTVVRIDTQTIDNTIGVVLSKPNKLYNRIGKGYKYYVPRGVTYIDTNELNDKLYSNGTYYYLYVDAISYYHKKDITYQTNPKAYYSRSIQKNGKKGYLEINKIDKDRYYIEFLYNYAKIEVITDKSEINSVILNSSYILSTVKFNNKVVKLMLNDNYFINKEEKYDVFTTKKQNNYFLEYVEGKKK